MKKSLLLVFAMGILVCAEAQNRNTQVVNIKNANNHCDDTSSPASTNATTPAQRKQPLVITNTAVNDIPLGNAANALGGAFRPARSIVYADPTLNAVVVTHRAGPACTPPDGMTSSGVLVFDYSKDGGMTWNAAPSFGPVWNSGVELGRYPSGVIYNPTGNTNPDSAYIAQFGPCTGPALPTGAIWIGHVRGAAKIGAVTQQAQGVDRFDSTVNWTAFIPDAMTMTQQGNSWVLDRLSDGTTAYTYMDTLILRKGTWNTTTKMFDYTTTLFPHAVTPGGNYSGGTIAFAPNGQTGWIVTSCHNDLALVPDSAMYLVAYKTTDGGSTWGAGIKIPVAAGAGAALGGTGSYSTAYWPDASVDSLGNLFTTIAIFPYLGAGSISIAPGTWGQFAVYTKDGGTTWQFKLLDKPSCFSYTTTGAAPISDWTRGQVSTNWTGSKVVCTWFDTDTIQFPGGINSNPNALAMYYDVKTDSWDPKVNLTAGSASDGTVTFGMVSQYLLPCGANSWEVPIAYQVLNGGNESGCVQYHYIDGACITGVNEMENAVFSISNAYPNPTNGTSTIDINMKQSGKITLEVSNMLGQVVRSTQESLTTGTHALTIDAGKWNSGIYFYTIKSKEFTITGMLVKE